MRVTLVAVSLATVAVLVACRGEDGGLQIERLTPDPTPTQAPPRATAVPSGTRTGIPGIDVVLDTVFSGDEEAVRALMQYTAVPCVTEISVDPGIRALCREGEEAGDLVEVFLEANCHGNHIRPEDTAEIVATLSQPGASLRAVARGRALGVSAGDYVAVYDHISSVRKDAALAVMITESRIVGMHATCGMTSDGFFEFHELDELLLYNPEEPRTGIPEIDNVLDTVFTGDDAAVRALIQYTPTACATNPQGLGSPPQCREGESDGSLSDFFAIGYCHGTLVRPGNMGGTISMLSSPGAKLRAVSAVEEVWPSGDHVVVYDHILGTNRVPHNALALVLREGAIVGIQDGCNGTPEEYLSGRNLDNPLLFIPPDGLTGIRELDMVLDGLALNDPDVVRAFIAYEFIPCLTMPESSGASPLCRTDEPPGERVEAFPLDTCELEYRRRDEMDDVRRWVADASLHAVYTVEARYQVVMRGSPPDDDLVFFATVEGRHIVGIESCGRSVYGVLDNVPPEDILVGPLLP